MTTKKDVLLVIDDDPSVRAATHLAFERYFEVVSAANEDQAIELFDAVHPKLIFLDIEFYGIPKGWDILKKIRERDSAVFVIVSTGLPINESEALARQANGFFSKPFERDAVLSFLVQKGILKKNTSF